MMTPKEVLEALKRERAVINGRIRELNGRLANIEAEIIATEAEVEKKER